LQLDVVTVRQRHISVVNDFAVSVIRFEPTSTGILDYRMTIQGTCLHGSRDRKFPFAIYKPR
jgi:hypothetical protein